MEKKGILTVVSGFSGAGKGTLMKELLDRYDYRLSISATTREPREGEEDGREYFFLTREDFESMIDHGELIEWAEYVGNYYGTPRAFVQQQLKHGQDVILEIEIQGAMNVKKLFPDSLLVFVTPPDACELKNRLEGRGTESAEEIAKRLYKANEEADGMDKYDVILVNDKLDECVELLHNLIQNKEAREPYATAAKGDFIADMKEQLKVFQKGE